MINYSIKLIKKRFSEEDWNKSGITGVVLCYFRVTYIRQA